MLILESLSALVLWGRVRGRFRIIVAHPFFELGSASSQIPHKLREFSTSEQKHGDHKNDQKFLRADGWEKSERIHIAASAGGR